MGHSRVEAHVEPITTDNILTVSFDDMRRALFGMIRTHDKSPMLDRALYVELLGEYAAIYQYFSELYTFMIGQVRRFMELRDTFRKSQAMDKRDCLEHALKAVKFEYDALSRKVTILSGEDS